VTLPNEAHFWFFSALKITSYQNNLWSPNIRTILKLFPRLEKQPGFFRAWLFGKTQTSFTGLVQVESAKGSKSVSCWKLPTPESSNFFADSQALSWTAVSVNQWIHNSQYCGTKYHFEALFLAVRHASERVQHENDHNAIPHSPKSLSFVDSLS